VAILAKLRGVLSRAEHRSELRFVLSFVVTAGILFSLYSFPYPEGSLGQRWSEGYLRAYSHLAGWVLAAFEPHVSVSGQNILGRYSLRIIRGCDAVDAQILLVAAVLASHVYSWRWRVAGVVAGFAVITAANVLRICSLYYVGVLVPAYFDFCHHELWPLLLIALAAGAFVLWSRVGSARGGIERAVGHAD
jgi:exosortase/archaeosortase family protein